MTEFEVGDKVSWSTRHTNYLVLVEMFGEGTFTVLKVEVNEDEYKGQNLSLGRNADGKIFVEGNWEPFDPVLLESSPLEFHSSWVMKID